MSWTSENRFLQGAFAPVFDERDDIGLQMEGRWPDGLDGAFMRNGPNPQFEPDEHYAYPFDGTGMIHALYVQGGQARYRNRWVQTQELMQERAAGRRIYNSIFSPPPYANLANTNVIQHAGRHLALYEGGVPYLMDRDLATVGPFDFAGRLPGAMSAHPKVDPCTQELLSIGYDLANSGAFYLRADAAGTVDRMVPFRAPWPAMVHDIAITEHHVVAFFCPLVFDLSGNGPPARWEPERGTMVALVPRDATSAEEVKWLQGPAFFHWHTVNAFERDGRIEVVIPWYEAFSLAGGASKLELHRIVIDTATGAVQDQALDDRACEFGRVHPERLGREARYGYVALRDPRPGEQQQPGAFEALARYDLSTGEKVVYRFAPGATVGEPVFVADPRGSGEADGFILSFVHDAGSAGGRFVVLDARRLEDGPVASVLLPRRVPAGLHGSWIGS